MLGQRIFELGNLVALGQVGIEVVLAGEQAGGGDLAAQRQPHPHGQLYSLAVDHRQHAGHAGAHRTHRGVGFRLRGIDHCT